MSRSRSCKCKRQVSRGWSWMAARSKLNRNSDSLKDNSRWIRSASTTFRNLTRSKTSQQLYSTVLNPIHLLRNAMIHHDPSLWLRTASIQASIPARRAERPHQTVSREARRESHKRRWRARKSLVILISRRWKRNLKHYSYSRVVDVKRTSKKSVVLTTRQT